MQKRRPHKITDSIALIAFMLFLSACAGKEANPEVQTDDVQIAEESETELVAQTPEDAESVPEAEDMSPAETKTVAEPEGDVVSEADNDERSEELDSPFQRTMPEEERECMQFWKEEYSRPLKGEDAEILQLRGNLELYMEKDAYPELRESLRQYNEQGKAYSEASSCRVIVHRADKRVLSFLECKNESADLQGYSFDPETGRAIELTDVVNDMEKLAANIDGQLRNKYSDVPFADDLRGKITSSWNESTKMTWTVSYHGICLYFFPGTLADKENGMLHVTVLFQDAPELFGDKYLQIPAAYAIELEDGVPFSYDMDMDGAADDIQIFHSEKGSEGTSVRVNDKQCSGEYDDWHYFEGYHRTYLLHTAGGNNYIAFSERGDLDGSSVYGLYGMEQDDVVYLGCGERSVYLDDNRITDPNFVNADRAGESLLREFGWCDAEYFITEQGFWDVKSPVYYYHELNWELKTLLELTLPAVDPYTGEDLGTEVIIPENTYLELLRTDGTHWSDFLLKDGTVCRMTFDERENFWDTVNYQGKEVDGEWIRFTHYIE